MEMKGYRGKSNMSSNKQHGKWCGVLIWWWRSMHATRQVRNRGTLSFQVRPRLRPTFCASPRRQNALGHAARTILCENSQVKCRRPRRFLQACAVVSQEPFYARILRLKCHKPRPRPTLSASLRSRNAHGQLTRAISCENLQEKKRKTDGAPWSSSGLGPCSKNPSVWTHCFRKNGGVNGKMRKNHRTKWWVFHGHVWLPEGSIDISNLHHQPQVKLELCSQTARFRTEAPPCKVYCMVLHVCICIYIYSLI